MQMSTIKNLEFQVGDWVFLQLSPWNGVVRFDKRGKLSPRYIGPYEIIERVGSLAYRLVLPPELSRIHNVFHVSMLRKYIADPSHVLVEQLISLQKDLSYEEEPVQILDRKEQVLRNKTIPLVKVLWRSHQVEEATWESEEQMRQHSNMPPRRAPMQNPPSEEDENVPSDWTTAMEQLFQCFSTSMVLEINYDRAYKNGARAFSHTVEPFDA
ncbi:hypothetical protein ACLB2K_037950 [Fragaria x ananassa]